MKILGRYVLRLHVGPFVFAISALTLIMLLDQVSKRFDQLVGKGLDPSVIAQVFLLSIPFILAMTLPMAVLVAVLYTFNRLAEDHEITAMKACGVSLPRIVLPVLLASIVLAAGMVWFNDTILPESNHRLSGLLSSIGRKKPTFVLRERTINEVLPGKLYLQAGQIDRETGRLHDVTIYDRRDPKRWRTIYADSGRVAYNASGTDLYVTLDRGTMHVFTTENPQEFQRDVFSRLVMRVAGVSNQLELQEDRSTRGDREMPIAEMEQEVAAGRSDAHETRRQSEALSVGLTTRLLGLEGPSPPPSAGAADTAPPDTAPADTVLSAALLAGISDTGQSRVRRFVRHYRNPGQVIGLYGAYETRYRAALQKENRFGVEIQKKYAIPAACLVFVLIGAPIAIRYPQGGVGMVVGVSLGFFCAYYVSLIGGEHLADKLILTPFWSMWAPNVLFGVIGLGLMWRAIRVG